MIAIGTDLVQLDRIAEVLERHGDRFLTRILTDAERAIYHERGDSLTFLANRFAAKEAMAKALGTGIGQGVRFTDLEVLPQPGGAPKATLYGAAQERFEQLGAQQMLISLSDERDFALAFVTIS